jgi:hypothetical protein
MKALMSIVITFVLASTSLGWGNGGKSKQLNSPKFGTHDWLAYEGYRLAKKKKSMAWLTNNLNAFFIGTEAPDVGAPSFIDAMGSYRDTRQCHCILFGDNNQVANNRAAMRAQEEFDKARDALANDNPELAAFYVGAMAHYLGDLSQFMHLMGKQSHWGEEDQEIHHRYEEVSDKRLDVSRRKSMMFQSYILEQNVPGDTAEEIAVAIARFTETGGGTTRNTGWMYDQWLTEIEEGNTTAPSNWDPKFLDQSGRNINMAVNGLAELLVLLSR